MKQALEALETNHYAFADAARHLDVMAHNDAIDALRLAIEQAEKQEPVAWQATADKCQIQTVPAKGGLLPTAPPQRQPLTKREIADAARDAQIAFCLDKHKTFEEALTCAIERAHGIGGEHD